MRTRSVNQRFVVINRVRDRESERFAREHKMRTHDRQLDDLYEKLYFHEIDGRDKVYQRLQLPLVSFIAIAGFVGSLLQNVRRDSATVVAIVFWVFMGLAILALIGAAGYFIASVVGKKYKYLGVPSDWKQHHQVCIDLYSKFEQDDKLICAALQKNVIDTYAYCATENGAINERKAYLVFMLLRCLVAAAIFTFLAFSVFYSAKLDKNLTKPIHSVEITNPITLKGALMANEKPPPPPPPPPAREIREDRPPPQTAPSAPKQPGQNHG